LEFTTDPTAEPVHRDELNDAVAELLLDLVASDPGPQAIPVRPAERRTPDPSAVRMRVVCVMMARLAREFVRNRRRVG
jgi:hypothetical protein